LAPFILSIDAGTTGVTILLLLKNGKILNKYYSEFTQHYPQPGWVEHDGEEIWNVTRNLMQSAFTDYSPNFCISIGITNQRETTIIWNKKTGKAIYNAIVWQCRRTQDICQDLSNSGYGDIIKQKTGLVIDSYFSGTKIKWLLDHILGARKEAKMGNLSFGTIDSWLLWKLTGGAVHATDYTNASRTMIFNIDEKQWDKDLVNILNIPNNILPEARPSCGIFGTTEKKLFGVPLPITGIAGDQQAALYGQGCIDPGQTKCTYGTGCFLLTNTGSKRINSNSGFLTTIACNSEGLPTYALEGSIFIGGALIQWLRDELQIITDVSETENIARQVENSNGVIIVPAFTGLGAPYWDMSARGTISGITRGCNRNHIVRAALESIAFQVNDLVDSILSDMDCKIDSLKVDGGASANNFLMQFQADILQLKIDRPSNIESTALGIGMLAGICAEFWNNPGDLSSIRETDEIFEPAMDAQTRKYLLQNWHQAVKRACFN